MKPLIISLKGTYELGPDPTNWGMNCSFAPNTYQVRHLSMTVRIPLSDRSGRSYPMTKQLTH